jgi:hypothetical protein
VIDEQGFDVRRIFFVETFLKDDDRRLLNLLIRTSYKYDGRGEEDVLQTFF